MPTKKCPKCSANNHVRRNSCISCGELFHKKESVKNIKESKNSVEPGNWINDKVKGMPEIKLPEPLTTKQLTKEEIRDIVSEEGLGYSITDYINPNSIIDDKLKEMWKTTRKMLKEIKVYIYQ